MELQLIARCRSGNTELITLNHTLQLHVYYNCRPKGSVAISIGTIQRPRIEEVHPALLRSDFLLR